MPDVHHARLGGVRLAYDVRGDPGGAPLVLLHALGEDRGDWAVVADRCAESFRVLAVDLRGHGASDWPGTYSFPLMAEDVVGLLDHLDLPRVMLLGHSMGGSVAYLVAQQHPERIERLIIEDVSPPFPRERAIPERPDTEPGFDWAVVPAIIGEVNRGNPAMWQQLAAITAPTLLVAGGPDSHVPQEKLHEVADGIPDCTMVTIPAGHDVHATRPVDFADAVLGWLASTAAS